MPYVPLRPKNLTVNTDADLSVTADVVLEEDKLPRDTGLLDSHGNKLYWVAAKLPFGFVR